MNVKVTTIAFSKNKTLRQELLKVFPNATFNEEGKRFSKLELIDFLRDADGAIIGLDQIDNEILSHCKNLKVISKYGVGLDNLDKNACDKYNVVIGWTGGVNRLSVAEMTLGFILGLCRNLFMTSYQLKNQQWNKSGGFQLSEKAVGIIGVGNIGKELIKLLKPFNCTLLVNDIIEQHEYYSKIENLREVSKKEIFEKADIITVHTPLTSDTYHLFDKNTFSQMQKHAFLINTARGNIVDLVDLKEALIRQEIAGVALDVYDSEPPSDQDLIALPNVICTPHIGGNAKEAVLAMGFSAIEHLKHQLSL